MIKNVKKQTKQNDLKIIAGIIAGFLLVAWFCTPPGNKILQICFWGNNTQMLIAKLQHKDTTEYLFHRNNAIYLAKMFPKDNKRAIIEMDKAIATIPTFVSEKELTRLYKERAQVNLFLGNYKQALSDYIHAGEFEFNDYLKIAVLYKLAGNYREAMSYCNAILNVDYTAYAGFACLADIYESAGKPEVGLKVWNLAIDRKQNNPRAYLSRAILKKKLGDMSGYEEDLVIARRYSPNININDSIIEDTLHPKILTLTIN